MRTASSSFFFSFFFFSDFHAAAPLPDELKTPKKGQQSPRVKLVPISKDKLAKSVETIQGLAPYLGGCAGAPGVHYLDLEVSLPVLSGVGAGSRCATVLQTGTPWRTAVRLPRLHMVTLTLAKTHGLARGVRHENPTGRLTER